MEIVGIVVLILGVGLVFAVALGILLLGRYLQGRRKQAWAQLAERYHLHDSSNGLSGVLDGTSVQLAIETRGSGEDKTDWTVASGFLSPPLDLGLSVSKEGLLSSAWASLAGTEDVQTGDAAFDAAFIVQGDEAGRVRALLHPALRQAFVQAASRATAVYANDTAVRITLQGAVSSYASLEWALRTTSSLAAMMAQGRENVPVAAPLATHRLGWEAFARPRGLQGMTTPLRIWGNLDGRAVSVYAIRSDRLTYQLEVFVRYPQNLGLNLLVQPSSTIDGVAVWFGGQDVEVGDQTFDPIFRVQAARPDRMLIVLDPHVRQRMVWLNQRYGSIQVRDDGVTLRAAAMPADPNEVLGLLGEASTLADQIFANAYR